MLLIITVQIMAQDIESISTEHWLKYKGGLGFNTSAYYSEGMKNRKDPFYFGLDANLNLTFFNIINVPLSAHYSKDNYTYNHPVYNYFGMSPSYKFVTIHAGYRSMQFSSYSLSGLTFLGGGIEINPENSIVKFSAMYGRLQKAVAYVSDSIKNTTGGVYEDPAFARWGWGGKVTIGKKDNVLDLIIFKAKDDTSSISMVGLDTILLPKENLIIGFNTKNKLFEVLDLQIEYTLSALSRNIRVHERELETFTYVNNLGSLFTSRYSTTVNKAYSVNLTYTGKSYTVGLVFKHIDPEYMSLGTTYVSNDLESIYLNLNKSFLENKLTFSGNIGKERDNLDNNLETTNKRVIGSANCNINLFSPFNISLNYSNFSLNDIPSSTVMKDTFRFIQVTKNYGVNLSYQLSGASYTHNFNFNTTWQNANTLNENATTVSEVNTDIFNINLSYNLFITSIKLNILSSVNYNYYDLGSSGNLTTGWAPTAGVNRAFLQNKIQAGLIYTWQNSTTDTVSTNNTHVIRFNANYKISKNQSLRLTLSSMFRSTNANQELTKQQEYNAKLSYNFTF